MYKKIIFFILIILSIFFLDKTVVVIGCDWETVFYPIITHPLENPYQYLAFNPFWAFIGLLPLSLFSLKLSYVINFVGNLAAYIYSLRKLKISWLFIVAFCLLPITLANSINGNIEGYVSLGFILPPQIGLFFLLSKVQIGLPVAIFFAVKIYRGNGIKQLFFTFLPVMIGFVISFLIYGNWMAKSNVLFDISWNRSIFPYGLPIGIIALLLSLYTGKIGFAIFSACFFSPYFTGHTWSFVIYGAFSVISDYLTQYRKEIEKLGSGFTL